MKEKPSGYDITVEESNGNIWVRTPRTTAKAAVDAVNAADKRLMDAHRRMNDWRLTVEERENKDIDQTPEAERCERLYKHLMRAQDHMKHIKPFVHLIRDFDSQGASSQAWLEVERAIRDVEEFVVAVDVICG